MTEPQTLHSYAGFEKRHILATGLTSSILGKDYLNLFFGFWY
jgi:hypothetical protein